MANFENEEMDSEMESDNSDNNNLLFQLIFGEKGRINY